MMAEDSSEEAGEPRTAATLLGEHHQAFVEQGGDVTVTVEKEVGELDVGDQDLRSADSRHRERLRRALVVLLRLALLAAVVAALGFLSRATGLKDRFSLERLQDFFQGGGPGRRALSLVLFVAAFCVGEVIQVPAPLFIWVAALSFGRWLGAMYSYVGAVFAVMTSFLLVRSIGGQPIRKIPWPFFNRILDMVENKPVQAVALIWLLFWCVPWVNYIMAMSSVKFRDYVLGSIIGLVVPIFTFALLFDSLMPAFRLIFGF